MLYYCVYRENEIISEKNGELSIFQNVFSLAL